MNGQESKKAIISGLNDAQKEAVLKIHGPLLVLAGAGSGKTKVIAHRIANIIDSGINPENVLAITFTNKASEEMQKRVSALLERSVGQAVSAPKLVSKYASKNSGMPFISTFHALGVFVLKESGSPLGITKNFSIFDSEDSLSLIKECLKELEIDPKQFQPARMRSNISKYKNELSSPRDLLIEAEDSPFLKILIDVWEKYDEKLKKHKALDFDDLIAKPVLLFEQHPEVLKKYQERWKYIHIDEYQDTNHAQYLLANYLAHEHKNICCVGDIDQSIYGWRGADFRNILNFETSWPNATIITLEENYRSTQTILDAANAVIIKNKERRPKNLFTQKSGGAAIKHFLAANEIEEAMFIANKIKNLMSGGVQPENIAVLYRTNFQSRVIEENFLELNIPYQLIGTKFYERKEIKDVLAYIRASINKEDLLSIKRIINTPRRGIGKVLMIKYLAGATLSVKNIKLINEFEEILNDIGYAIANKSASEVMRFIIKKTGYESFLSDGTDEGLMRLANIQELSSLAVKYDKLSAPDGIEQLLADAALMSDQDTIEERGRAVKLMTVHAAKGLEFNSVFIAGLEEGLFPHTTMGGDDDGSRQEEERRLFYVALTRAEENLFLSNTFFRTIFGSKQINAPSKFLEDIPEHLIKAVTPEEILDIIDINEI